MSIVGWIPFSSSVFVCVFHSFNTGRLAGLARWRIEGDPQSNWVTLFSVAHGIISVLKLKQLQQKINLTIQIQLLVCIVKIQFANSNTHGDWQHRPSVSHCSNVQWKRDSLCRRLSGLPCKDVSEAAWRLLWFGSSLSLLMNPAGPDLATISQLHHTAQCPPPNERRADEQRGVVRRRTLGGCWQEAVTQSPRPLKQRQLKRPVSFSYRRVICVSSILRTVLEVHP